MSNPLFGKKTAPLFATNQSVYGVLTNFFEVLFEHKSLGWWSCNHKNEVLYVHSNHDLLFVVCDQAGEPIRYWSSSPVAWLSFRHVDLSSAKQQDEYEFFTMELLQQITKGLTERFASGENRQFLMKVQLGLSLGFEDYVKFFDAAAGDIS